MAGMISSSTISRVMPVGALFGMSIAVLPL